jgi:hypothetical protein
MGVVRGKTGVMGETFRGKKGLGFEDRRAGGHEGRKRHTLKGKPETGRMLRAAVLSAKVQIGLRPVQRWEGESIEYRV